MTPRSRLFAFGGAILVMVLGGIGGLLAGGVAGEAVAIALMSLGGVAIVSLLFLEVGLSEDRERERSAAPPPARTPAPRLPRIPRRRGPQ